MQPSAAPSQLSIARDFRELEAEDMTVLSTGTWFIVMRSMAQDARINIAALPEERDCLVNVDAYGALTPSARLVGGREVGLLSTADKPRIDSTADQPAFVAASRRATLSLCLALVSDTSLNFIGTRDRLLIEGRFAQREVFVRALAALCPRDRVFVCETSDQADVSFGALRVIDPTLRPRAALRKVVPLGVELRAYAARWRRDVAGTEAGL